MSVDLPAPILAQQRVDLARQQIEIDAGIGDDAGKALDDAAHFDDSVDRCFCHSMALCFGHGQRLFAHLEPPPGYHDRCKLDQVSFDSGLDTPRPPLRMLVE